MSMWIFSSSNSDIFCGDSIWLIAINSDVREWYLHIKVGNWFHQFTGKGTGMRAEMKQKQK
jgi:hypothetical protein